jgi:hypothetical protein
VLKKFLTPGVNLRFSSYEITFLIQSFSEFSFCKSRIVLSQNEACVRFQ